MRHYFSFILFHKAKGMLRRYLLKTASFVQCLYFFKAFFAEHVFLCFFFFLYYDNIKMQVKH